MENHTSDSDTDALTKCTEEGEDCDAKKDIFYIDGCLDAKAHGREKQAEAETSDEVEEDLRLNSVNFILPSEKSEFWEGEQGL